jgi:alkylhydroperoxidase family enzyme
MTTTFAELDAQWSASWLEPVTVPADLGAAIHAFTGGTTPVWASRLAAVPWVVRAFLCGLDKTVAYMPVELWDLIAFVVSRDNACRYCYGATRTILRILGYPEATIDRLERDVDLAELTPAEQAALRFSRKVSHANPPPGAADLRALGAAGFSSEAAGEIAYVAAFTGYGNRVATAFALPPDGLERVVRHPLRRLLRPFIARYFRGRRQPPMRPPAPNPPPFAAVVARLGGSPTAHRVRAMLDEALASPVLPRRTKLLMFAVIGRAAGCRWTEHEATDALAAEGFPAPACADVLANLASPALDAREQRLVPFARETVRYRNLALQARTRALAGEVALPELIEAVGTAALANSVARLTVLLDPC